jgi:hypothetical protein
VLRSGGDLAGDVFHDDVNGNDAESPLIDGHHRAMTAQVFAPARAFGETGPLLRAIGELEPRIAMKRRKPRTIWRDKVDFAQVDFRAGIWLLAGAQLLGEREQPGLDLAAENRADAQVPQHLLVDRRVKAVCAEMGLRRERANAGESLDRDTGRGMHSEVERDQSGVRQCLRIELFQAQVEAADVESRAIEPRRRLREIERLPPELVRIDEDDLECLRSDVVPSVIPVWAIAGPGRDA